HPAECTIDRHGTGCYVTAGNVPVIFYCVPGACMRRFAPRRALRWASLTVVVSASLVTGSLGTASTAAASTSTQAVSRGIGSGTRFFLPPPSAGAPQQV